MSQEERSLTPVFDKGNARRKREAQYVLGDDYLKKMIVKIGELRLDPASQSGAILILAEELLGLLGNSPEIDLSGELFFGKKGARMIVSRRLRDLDREVILPRFAELYEDEVRYPKGNCIVRFLMDACRLRERITVEICLGSTC